MKVRLTGWHSSTTVEVPEIQREIRIPAMNPDKRPLAAVMVVQRVFRIVGRLHLGFPTPTPLVTPGERELIERGAGAVAWYEEAGRCELDPATQEQQTCPCATCEIGWTKPGEKLPWGR